MILTNALGELGEPRVTGSSLAAELQILEHGHRIGDFESSNGDSCRAELQGMVGSSLPGSFDICTG